MSHFWKKTRQNTTLFSLWQLCFHIKIVEFLSMKKIVKTQQFWQLWFHIKILEFLSLKKSSKHNIFLCFLTTLISRDILGNFQTLWYWEKKQQKSQILRPKEKLGRVKWKVEWVHRSQMPNASLGWEPNHEDYNDENDQKRCDDVTNLFSLHHLKNKVPLFI